MGNMRTQSDLLLWTIGTVTCDLQHAIFYYTHMHVKLFWFHSLRYTVRADLNAIYYCYYNCMLEHGWSHFRSLCWGHIDSDRPNSDLTYCTEVHEDIICKFFFHGHVFRQPMQPHSMLFKAKMFTALFCSNVSNWVPVVKPCCSQQGTYY